MASKRTIARIKRLAAACKEAYAGNKHLWIDSENNSIFDFPEYGGLPKRMAYSLSSDCVDVIQEFTFDLAATKHQRFSKVALEKTLREYAEGGYTIP